MKYEFDAIIDRTGTNCEKWDQIPKYFPKAKEDSLCLWVADMDFACAKPIVDALHERVDRLIYGYTDPQNDEYEAVVRDWFQRRLQWTIAKGEVFFSPGVVPGIAFLLRILSKQGQGIIIQEPVYYPFARAIRDNDRVVVNNALCNEQGIYRMDYEALEIQMRDPNNAGLLLCSPHNPVGRVWTSEELCKVVDIAKRHGKWIISDEIHCDIIRNNQQHLPLAKLCSDYQNQIFTCTAPSKSFNLAGIQCSNIIIHNPVYQHAWKQEVEGRCALQGANAFAHIACIAAYRDSEDWLNEVNAYIDGNIAFATEYIQQYLPQAIVSESQGTYLLWVDVRKYCSDKELLETYMQQEAGVILDEGYVFGEAGIGFERINVATTRPLLSEALQRMCEVLLHHQ